MNGFDLLLLGILTLTGGAIFITLGRLRLTRVSLQRARADRVGRKSDASREQLDEGGNAVGSQAAGPKGGRLASRKRMFTITRARRESAPPSPAQPSATLSHITQCPEDSFWKDWQGQRKRPEA